MAFSLKDSMNVGYKRWYDGDHGNIHDSITSVVHIQVNVLCSECGVFLVKCSVTVMSSSSNFDEFRCCQIRAMVSDIGTLLMFPCQCCVRCGELAQVAQFCSFSVGMMRSGLMEGGGDHPDPVRSHISTCFSLHSQNTTNLNKFV